MYAWYVQGLSIKEIQGRLSRNGVMTRRGNHLWSLGSIQLILRNPVYVGYFDYTDKMVGETVRITTPALIDATTYQSAQDRRKGSRNRRVNALQIKHFYLLRGLLVCGHCGTLMSGRINRAGHQNFYYCAKKERVWKSAPDDSPKWVRGKACSLTRSINIDRTDQLVISMAASIIRDTRESLSEKMKQNSVEKSTISEIDQDLLDVLTTESVMNIGEMPREDQRDLLGMIVSSIRVRFDGKTGKHAVDLDLTAPISRLLDSVDEPSGTPQDRPNDVEPESHDAHQQVDADPSSPRSDDPRCLNMQLNA
jgi:hypothetical protein